MRYTLLTLIIALIATVGTQSTSADVTWLSHTCDFGAFNEDGGPKTATFRFVNTTDSPVSILQATATCGCTTPKYSTDAVAPGDTAVLHVSYDPAGRPGRFVKYVYVRTSASHEKTKLRIQGAVIGSPESLQGRFPIEMGPMRLRSGAVMAGKVYKGHGRMSFLDIYNSSTDTLRPVIVGAPRYINVSVEPEKIGPGDQGVINVYYRGDLCPQWGMVTDSLYISAMPGGTQYLLPVVALVEEDFSVLDPDARARAPRAVFDKDSAMLGNVPSSGAPVKTVVGVGNAGEDPLLIRRAYSEDPGITVKTSKDKVKKGGHADIVITFDPSVQPEGLVNARVTVITNDPANPTKVIRVVGER